MSVTCIRTFKYILPIPHLCYLLLAWIVISIPLTHAHVNESLRVHKDIRETKHYAFSPLDNKSIESIGALWAIVQDQKGFMWFGGENGLARYDGYDLKIYRNKQEDQKSLSSSYVHDLLLDSSGRLWVGTIHGLNLYEPDTDTFQRFFNEPDDPYSLAGNGIRCLLEDGNGKIWVGHGQGGLTRLDPDIQYFEQFKHEPNNPDSLAENSIYDLAVDKNGALWIGTSSQGVDRLIIENTHSSYLAKFQHFKSSDENPESLSSNETRALLVDQLNQVWVGTRDGLNRYDRDRGTFARFKYDDEDAYSLSFNFVQDLAEDSDGNLWIATSGGGLNVFQRDRSQFIRYSHNPEDKSSLFNNNVRTMYLDRHGNFWLGHYAAGVSMLDRYASAFKNYYHSPYHQNSLNYNEVVAIAENQEGNLWVGTAKGLNLLDRKTGLVTRYLHRKDDPTSINYGGVLGMEYDSKARLWVGLWGGGLNRLNPGSNQFTHYMSGADKSTGLYTDTVWQVAEDSAGQIWAGNHMGGLTYLDEQQNQFVRIANKNANLLCDSVFSIFEDSAKGLWVGCSNGLYWREYGSDKFNHYFHIEDRESSISANHIWAIQEDQQGVIWIGTQGGGVNRFDRHKQEFKSFRTYDGLADDLVTGILQDDLGYLWFGTGNGLSRFDPRTETFRNYDQRHGLPGNVFNRAAFLKTQNNELVFGSKDGLTIFNPRQLTVNIIPPEVVLTDFRLFNKQVIPGQENSPLKKSIFQADEIILNHDQSSFSIQFSALNYRVPTMNRYAYKLEGFDADWVNVSGRRWAYYTNLDPGRYTFFVKASNNEDVWSEENAEIEIIILPPWWKTPWAYLAYVVLLFTLVLLISYGLWQRKIAEHERKVSDRLREIDKIKNTFLANTSHELRTPLHGIIGLAESLYNGVTGPLPKETLHYLNMIIISGKRLANLVNDILDFSKIRDSKVSLRKTAVDLYTVTEVVAALFAPMLRERKISLVNNVPEDLPLVMADENRLQQILYNLIGNAVKFTDEGQITINVKDEPEFICVSVQDTGIGIAEDKQESIFNSFEQIEDDVDRGVSGTGLGLAVTKQLVELHGGNISLTSTLEKGSTFTFCLPKARNNVAPNRAARLKKSQSNTGSQQEFLFAQETESTEPSSTPSEFDGCHILVVDDEPVNRLVLEGFLKLKRYRITECGSGAEALKILDREPDVSLVLLDVMMPKMSGLEVCTKIREKYNAKELPVIFLTGKNQREDLEAGYRAGANDFLNKPIAKEELLLRVETHLRLSLGLK